MDAQLYAGAPKGARDEAHKDGPPRGQVHLVVHGDVENTGMDTGDRVALSVLGQRHFEVKAVYSKVQRVSSDGKAKTVTVRDVKSFALVMNEETHAEFERSPTTGYWSEVKTALTVEHKAFGESADTPEFVNEPWSNMPGSYSSRVVVFAHGSGNAYGVDACLRLGSMPVVLVRACVRALGRLQEHMAVAKVAYADATILGRPFCLSAVRETCTHTHALYDIRTPSARAAARALVFRSQACTPALPW